MGAVLLLTSTPVEYYFWRCPEMKVNIVKNTLLLKPILLFLLTGVLIFLLVYLFCHVYASVVLLLLAITMVTAAIHADIKGYKGAWREIRRKLR